MTLAFRKYQLTFWLVLINLMVNASVKQDSLQVETKIPNTIRAWHGFKNKYNAPIFDYNRTQHINKKTFWDTFKQWLAERIAKLFDIHGGLPIDIIEKGLQILGGLIVLFVLYKITTTLLSNNKKGVFARSTNSLESTTDEIEKNLLNTNFDTLIKKATSDDNFRLAIRFYFLKTLQQLHFKQIIEWQFEKTNKMYTHEIHSQNLKTRFNYLAYLYDYSWYGEFEVDKNKFEIAKSKFQSFINSL